MADTHPLRGTSWAEPAEKPSKGVVLTPLRRAHGAVLRCPARAVRGRCGPSGIKGDFGYKACSAFCKEASSASHCKFCKRSLNTQRSVLRYRA